MTSKHTPGPWTLAFNWRDKMAIIGPKGGDDRICNLPHRKDRQGRHNARLIAKAPEMYELLYWFCGEAQRMDEVTRDIQMSNRSDALLAEIDRSET